MPRQPFNIQQVYIADGFADDCDELIQRCSRVDVLSYQTFCIYYKEMNFASMFQGRTSNAEIAELSEELLQIAKYYMVLDTSNFEESVAGLFLVYALLNLQPYPRFAALRLVPEDLPALERVQRVARRERRHDVLFILGSVLVRGPVQFHAAARPRGMETSIRKYLDGFCNIDVTGVRPKGVYFRQNEELDIIRDMSGIFKRYSHAKGQIPGLQKRVLSYSNDNLPSELGASLKKVINGIAEDEVVSDVEHHDAVQEIKKRAMKNAVAMVRHLDSASQRSPEKKIQQEKPTTSTEITHISEDPKRRPKKPLRPKESKGKRYKNNYTSSSSSEDTEDENGDWCLGSYGNLDEIAMDEEQEINVEIDSLPSLITTESDGKLVEIEIIDEMEKTKEVTKEDEITKADTVKEGDEMTKIGEIEDEMIIVDNVEQRNVTKGRDEAANLEENPKMDTKRKAKDRKRGKQKKEDTVQIDKEIFKKPLRSSPRLKPVLKRDMKKPILKSKFKKMGMLSLANFDEQK